MTKYYAHKLKINAQKNERHVYSNDSIQINTFSSYLALNTWRDKGPNNSRYWTVV